MWTSWNFYFLFGARWQNKNGLQFNKLWAILKVTFLTKLNIIDRLRLQSVHISFLGETNCLLA